MNAPGDLKKKQANHRYYVKHRNDILQKQRERYELNRNEILEKAKIRYQQKTENLEPKQKGRPRLEINE